MKKLYKKLFALSLTLALALAITACDGANTSSDTATPTTSTEEQISSDNALVVSTEEKETQSTNKNSKPQTSVNNSTDNGTNSTSKNQNTSSKNTTSKTTNTSKSITKAKAKAIALSDAGLKESQVYDLEVELDRDKGVLHYDVSFEYKGKDYDYEIDAKTGKIISVDKPNVTDSDVKISKEKAKKIALDDAGVDASEIHDFELELEKEKSIWKYEISFKKGNKEYEYTINASTGKIIHKQIEHDD